MARPVNEIRLTKSQLAEAVQTYLNEHVFRDAVTVDDVSIDQYGDEAKIKLREAPSVADGA